MFLFQLSRWQQWDNGKLWFWIYWMRSAMLLGLAASSWIVDAQAASVFILVVVIPYNIVAQCVHGRNGIAPPWLVIDQLLAAFGVVIEPKALVCAVICIIVSGVTGTLGAGRQRAEVASLLAGALLFIEGLAMKQATLIAFAWPIALGAICMVRMVDYINGRSHTASSRFEELLNGLNAAIYETDVASGKVLYANRRSAEFAGKQIGSLRELLSLVHPDDAVQVSKAMNKSINRREPINFEIRTLINNRTRYFEHRSTFSVRNNRQRMRSVLIDVSDRKSIEIELQHRTLHDSLTELPNRVFIRRRIDQITNPVGVADVTNAVHAVLILDLDSFKDVNDGLGHHQGDLLLIEIAHRLRSVIRPSDVISRLGGDEFGVLLHDCDDVQAKDAAVRIRKAISQPYQAQGLTLRPDVSIGIARYPVDATTTADLLRLGDVAMYRAKREGTGYAMYSQSSDGNRDDHLQIVSELRRAIREGQLEPFFQPLVETASQTKILSCEALVRWHHPARGLLEPDQFMAAIESGGLSNDLARYMLTSVIAQLDRWHKLGIAVPIAVNISASDLCDPKLMAWLRTQLNDSEFPNHLLNIELTESELLLHADRAIGALMMLRELGVNTAVDDFGTGCSSLVWLRDLPVTSIKIDRSFVHTMCADDRSHTIVKSTIALAHALGLNTVGEGVETVATANALVRLGCTQMQGFLYSKPVMASDFSDLLNHGLLTDPAAAGDEFQLH